MAAPLILIETPEIEISPDEMREAVGFLKALMQAHKERKDGEAAKEQESRS